ncbi:PIG-P-domain-containing protein [Punctularia strigosozonata HHB-11173 SS5]|uniref:PIG-P-domain-containing protein n=1 Tax=Punctularia strigosozonata (strain HHB-11173) TaxID=741275 RepID=UPI000441774C|nr:PIG-P-domain-containing protein [Punctularia strigosozonata HHB-11173 SS5]EIN08569.1 PIG-P-domain-containing protein [Punctularia strigosozonata HHB-11173 SS5]
MAGATSGPTSPTSPTSPLAPFPPEPSPEDRSRAQEFYGFVAWTSTYLLYILFLLWAFLPDEWLIWLGIEWYPSREWALLLPAWSMVLVLFTYAVYLALALAGTPQFSDVSTITDPYFAYAFDDANPERAAVPEMYDIPIGLVNRVTYARKPN